MIEHAECNHFLSGNVEGFCTWTALRNLIGHENCDSFMFMGRVRGGTDGDYIYLYKHRDTRSYLNVDLTGACWKWHGATDTYQPIRRDAAILHAMPVTSP